MPKEVNRENLRKYAEEHLNDTASAVASGILDAKTARGHVRELFYLSGSFDLGLQEEARKIIRKLKE